VSASGIVIGVHRGGCDVVAAGRVRTLQLVGRHAQNEVRLAVGDEVSFDDERGIVLEVAERRTELRRLRPQAGRRKHDVRDPKLIAANMDRLAIVATVDEPPFRAGIVDRFLLAALAGGLDALLIVNKIDLLGGAPLPDEILAYERVLPVLAVSASERLGLDTLREALAGSRTVFAGHSGVGKSSLLNAMEPLLRLETGEVSPKTGKGRHTTTHAVWLELGDGAVAVDTPGIRELATGPVDPQLLDRAYPDVLGPAEDCRFADCRHDREPDCAVRAAVESGEVAEGRLRAYRKLLAEIESG
jgi:ribosome biogenesis GTPase